MTVTCHQPHFLPWIPYLNKLFNSDLFIVLDDFAYRKNYFMNRTVVLSDTWKRYWITVPVIHARLGTPLTNISIARDSIALRTSINRLRDAYRSHSQNEFLRTVLGILSNPPPQILELNLRLLSLTLEALEHKTVPMIPISRIVDPMPGKDRILAALKKVGADRVIVGMGAMAKVNNLRVWEEAGIALSYQRPMNIPALSSVARGNGISVLHDIVTRGARDASMFVREFWSPTAI